MKTKILLTTTLLLSGLANAQVTNTDVLNNRTEITRASIRTSIDDLRNASGVSSGEHGDLEIQLKAFTQKVEAGLNKYSQDYETKVIRPVKLMVQDYNNVKSSPAYTAEEKMALLEDIYNRMVVIAANLSKSFQAKSMKELIALTGFKVEGWEKIEVANNNSSSSNYLFQRQIVELLKEFPASYDFLITVNSNKELAVDLAQVLPFYQVYNNCFSRGCQTLWHLTLLKYRALLDKLDSDFTLTIDKDRSIMFMPAGDYSLIYMGRAIDWGYTYFSNVQLPFNVDKKGMDLLDEVVQTVNTARDLTECKAEMQRLKPLLCNENEDLCQNETVNKILKTKVVDIILPDLQKQIDQLNEEIKSLIKTKEELEFTRSHYNQNQSKWYKLGDKIIETEKQITALTNKITGLKKNNISDRQSCLD